jgi:type II secretory pathway pseudopilin PulG
MYIVPTPITIVLYPGQAEDIMPKKRKIGFILEAIVVFLLIAVLSSIAVPQIKQMVGGGQDELRATELNDIQGAVAEMLADSSTGTLKPVGPTQDMGQVVTDDIIPLVLMNYLGSNGVFSIKSDCYYIFSSDGIVTQDCPQVD